MSTHYTKIIAKLRELFEPDKADSKLMHNMALDIFAKGDNEHWKVRLIEEEFQRLMFLEQ